MYMYIYTQMDTQNSIKSHYDSLLTSLEIHNLSIGQSEFELRPGEGIGMEITNVSAVFSGTIQYGYGNWLWVCVCVCDQNSI